jgi:hypothetical protein
MEWKHYAWGWGMKVSSTERFAVQEDERGWFGVFIVDGPDEFNDDSDYRIIEVAGLGTPEDAMDAVVAEFGALASRWYDVAREWHAAIEQETK